MRAMLLHELGGRSRREIAEPAVGPNDAKVRIRAAGVGLTIIIMKSTPGLVTGYPRVPGHEIAGEVVEVGSEVRHVKAGDLVVCHFYLTCGACRFCRSGRETLCDDWRGYVGMACDGGYAEYMTVPAANLCHLPPGIPFPEASVISDAVATPLHACRQEAKVGPGDNVLVIGAGGGVGIHAVQMAKLCGGRVLAADISPLKLDLAKVLGADEIIDAKEKDIAQEVRRPHRWPRGGCGPRFCRLLPDPGGRRSKPGEGGEARDPGISAGQCFQDRPFFQSRSPGRDDQRSGNPRIPVCLHGGTDRCGGPCQTGQNQTRCDRDLSPRRGGKGPSTLPGESDRRAGRPDRLIPIPNQSAILVGFVIGSSSYECIRLRRLFLAALISSLIWNRNKTMCCPDRQRGARKKRGKRAEDPLTPDQMGTCVLGGISICFCGANCILPFSWEDSQGRRRRRLSAGR